MKSDVYNTQGKKVSSVELPESVFNLPWNSDLVHQVVTAMSANFRSPLAHTKTRGEVSGGADRPAIGIEIRGALFVHPFDAAIVHAQAMNDVVRCVLFQGMGVSLVDDVAVLRVNHLEEGFVGCGERPLVDFEDAKNLVRPVQPAR